MCACVRVCVFVSVSYFSKGADDGALYDASEEDKIDVFGSCS